MLKAYAMFSAMVLLLLWCVLLIFWLFAFNFVCHPSNS